MDAEIDNVIYMELNSGPKSANSTCGKTIIAGTIDRDSTVIRSEAKGIQQRLSSQEMAFMASVWDTILERFNAVNTKLQAEEVDVSTVVGLYTSLVAFLDEMVKSFKVYTKLGEEKLESSQHVLQIEENTPKHV